MLLQKIDGGLRPLAFFCRVINKAQLKYSVFDKELTAMYMAVKHFKYFLEGRSFKVVTDQRSITRVSQQILLTFRHVKVGILILLRSILLISFIFQVQRMLLQIASPRLNAILFLKNFLLYLNMR